MIVGVGASRVRDLFDKAKAAAPSIVFVDEIDAIGRSRGSGVFSGANDEREQTLNQILTEMDGFDASTGVIVLAATNRPDVLDPALLRPGRFDRRVTVQPPDKGGASRSCACTRSVPLASDVDLGALAATTVGMVGADLANLVNEGALLAARRKHELVQMGDFTDALEKIVLGAARKVMLSDEDRRRTAYHEAGHAITGMLTPGADPVRKISIIPRSRSLGVTVSAPETDQFNYDKQALLARIRVAAGGRAAEEVVYGDETTGAENDIRQATELARQMVGRFGMSDEIGFVAVLPPNDEASALAASSQVSERTRQRLDDEVKRIVTEAHDEAVRLLTDNRSRLDSLAETLVREETLDQPQAYAAAGLTPRAAAPRRAPLLSSARHSASARKLPANLSSSTSEVCRLADEQGGPRDGDAAGRLLGPFEVIVDGKPVDVPGAKRQALVACLALRAGRVVGTDTLVEALWGSDLPAAPRNAVQHHVTRLRRALGADAIRLATDGYALEDAVVDAAEFEELVAAARAALRAGDAAGAAATIAEALSLWRGPALLGLPPRPGPLLRPAAGRASARCAGRAVRGGSRARSTPSSCPPYALRSRKARSESDCGAVDAGALPKRSASGRAGGVSGGSASPLGAAGARARSRLRRLQEAILAHDPAIAPVRRAKKARQSAQSIDLVRGPRGGARPGLPAPAGASPRDALRPTGRG